MDTSEEQVFLFIENRNAAAPFGNLYISDEKGRTFTLSISNVVKMGGVDFEKISSLDGTFVVNRYDADLPAMSRPLYGDDSDIQVLADPADAPITKQMVEDNMKTYISHNKGANWEPI